MAITQSIHGPRPKFLVPSSSTPPRLSETALTFGHTMSLGGAMGCLRKGVILLWMRFHVERSGQKTLELGFRRGIGWAIDPQVPALFAQSHGFFFRYPPSRPFFTSFANLCPTTSHERTSLPTRPLWHLSTSYKVYFYRYINHCSV